MQDDRAVAFVDEGHFPGITEFFKLVPFVYLAPSRPQLRVVKVVPIETMSLLQLVDNMAMELSPGDSAVIYSHGSATQLRIGTGLYTSKVYPTASEFNFMANHVAGLANGTQRNLNPVYLKVDSDAGAQMVQNLQTLAKLRLRHLCVLACNTGNGPDLLRAMKRALSFESISGPKFRCAFGVIEFGLLFNQEEFSAQLEKVRHGVGGWHVYGTLPGRRVVFQRRVNPDSSFTFIRNTLWAESPFAIADFQRDIVGYPLPSTGYVQERPTFMLHGLETGAKLIFPGEHDYDQSFTLL